MDDVKEVDSDDDPLDNWNAKQVRGMVDMVSSRPCSFIGSCYNVNGTMENELICVMVCEW